MLRKREKEITIEFMILRELTEEPLKHSPGHIKKSVDMLFFLCLCPKWILNICLNNTNPHIP